MNFPEEISKQTQNRISRVKGQLAAVEVMLQDQKDCKEILIQLAAANKAIQSATVNLFTSALKYCASNDEFLKKEDEYGFEDIEKLFTKII